MQVERLNQEDLAKQSLLIIIPRYGREVICLNFFLDRSLPC